MAFVLHLPIVIPYLQELQTVFLESIFYSSWKYLILFVVLDETSLQVRFQICCYLCGLKGLRGPGDMNLTQLMIYLISISIMLF